MILTCPKAIFRTSAALGVVTALYSGAACCQPAPSNIASSIRHRVQVLTATPQISHPLAGAAAGSPRVPALQTTPAVGNMTLELKTGAQPLVVRTQDGGTGIKDWVPLIVGALTLVGAFAAVAVSARNTKRSIDASLKSTELTIAAGTRNADHAAEAAARTAEAAIWQRANEMEIADLQARLDGFFGPLLLLLDSVHLIAQEIRSRQDIKTYRLLVSLFDDKWREALSPGDRILVKEICDQDSRIEAFIRQHAQLMEEELRPHLSRAVAHFRILQLAHDKQLGSDPTHYSRYIYPEHLDQVLRLEVSRLKARIAHLRAHPAARPPPLEPLIIPEQFSLRPWPEPPRALLPQYDGAHQPEGYGTRTPEDSASERCSTMQETSGETPKAAGIATRVAEPK